LDNKELISQKETLKLLLHCNLHGYGYWFGWGMVYVRGHSCNLLNPFGIWIWSNYQICVISFGKKKNKKKI